VEKNALISHAVTTDIMKSLLTTYFKYIDQDYRDLKKILGMDPLCVTIVRCGTFEKYKEMKGKEIGKMNPSPYELRELLELQKEQRR